MTHRTPHVSPLRKYENAAIGKLWTAQASASLTPKNVKPSPSERRRPKKSAIVPPAKAPMLAPTV